MFEQRYFAPSETSWAMLADRVSGLMQYENEREAIKELLIKKDFLPNSPCLLNAGRAGGRSLVACNIIHVPNSIEGIFNAVKWCSLIFKAGAGVGLEFSELSPAGTPLRYIESGKASGVVSFMQNFNEAARSVSSGGFRRAAMLGLLGGNHPDALRFIECKQSDGDFENFNISISLPNGPDSIPREVWDKLIHHAWLNGEPGVVFWDNINADNPTLQKYGPIKAVNACSEYPGYNFSSCVLGSINLPNVISKVGDYGYLRRVARQAVRFLDRIIDVNPYPLAQIAQATRLTRDVGLGVMGWADLLDREAIPFTSRDALDLAVDVGSVIHIAAIEESWALAEEKGGYLPDCRRNRVLTTLPPTGHTAQVAGVSKSIYASYPAQLKMTARQHLDLLEAWSVNVDSSISYTACFPNDYDKSFVEAIFQGAYERGLKNVSVYRDDSRENQPCKGECRI